VESIVASLQEDEEAEPLLDFFTQNAFSIRLNIRGCVFTGNWFCHMRNAALIRDCAEALYITSNPENEILLLPKELCDLLHHEMKIFQKEFIHWVRDFDTLESSELTDEWGLFVRK